MLKLLQSTQNFLICSIRDDCPYSIKKILSYLFAGVVFYLVIFTDKNYTELLGFIALLLGLRTWEKKIGAQNPKPNDSEKLVLKG